MLHLYLLRHGKAVKYKNSDTDFQRKLNKKGSAQTNVLGFQLKAEGFQADEIISSGAIRTRETTAIVNHHLGIDEVSHFNELFLASKDVILHHIIKYAKHDKVLFVGHNFGISDLANYLTEEAITMSTSCFLEIQFELDDWNLVTAGTGTIVRMIEPNVIAF